MPRIRVPLVGNDRPTSWTAIHHPHPLDEPVHCIPFRCWRSKSSVSQADVIPSNPNLAAGGSRDGIWHEQGDSLLEGWFYVAQIVP